MKKIANFIVNKRLFVMLMIGILAVFSALLALRVGTVTDMTQYLPNDSAMRMGIDMMEEEFPAIEEIYTIRVMVDGLSDAEKLDFEEALAAIPYVDSVTYEENDAAYNQGEHTLFIINTPYEYSTSELQSIEHALANDFSGYDLTYQNDKTTTDLPLWAIVAAVGLLTVILLLMSGSWIEPMLFLVTIGAAVLLNAGTNIFLGSVSTVTNSISAILQLVLSMDYSIILINRYKQELPLANSKSDAMKAALTHSFSSIAGSAATTVVGLLMLVFMSFKIGFDLGIVLAKGVFLSMVCVFTFLPGLILLFDKAIKKTAKPVPDFSMRRLAVFSSKFRYAIVGVFLVLLVGSFLLKGNTRYTYTMVQEDAISEVFPTSNQIVMLYDNRDEQAVTAMAEQLENNTYVTGVSNYSTTIGREYTAGALVKELEGLDTGMDLDASLLNILYYHYYKDGQTGSITASDFLNFLADDVLENETFAEHIGNDMTDNIDAIKKFADADSLTLGMDAVEMADFFDMDAEDTRQLFLYYYIENGGVNSGRMTLGTFANFLKNDVLADPDYASMVPASARSQIDRLITFSNAQKMTTPYSIGDLAGLIGMDAGQVKLLYVYYYALRDGYQPGGMTVPTFVDFIRSTVANDPAFGSQFTASTMAQMDQLAQLTDTTTIQKQMSSAELAGLLGMDAGITELLYNLYYGGPGGSGMTMTLPQFTGMLVGMMDNPVLAGQFDDAAKAQLRGMDAMMQAAVSGQEHTAEQLALLTGLDEGLIGLLFVDKNVGPAMTLPAFTDFLVNTIFGDPSYDIYFDAAAKAQLTNMNQMAAAAVNGTAFNAQTLAGMVGMDENLIKTLFALAAGSHVPNKTMSPEGFVDYLLADIAQNPLFAGQLGSDAGQLQMLQTAMKSTLSGEYYNHTRMAGLLGMDTQMMKLLFTLHDSYGNTSGWLLSMQQTVNFIVANSDTFAAMLGDDLSELETAQKLINGAVAGTRYSSRDMAALLDMDAGDLNSMFLLYISKYGNTSGWLLSAQTFVDFIICDVLTNEDMADNIDADAADMLDTAKSLIDAVVSQKTYTATELVKLVSGISDELDANSMGLLYLYYFSTQASDPSWKLSMHTLFNYLADDIMTDPRFSDFLDADMREDVADMRDAMSEALEQLQGPQYSRLVFNTKFPIESNDTTEFISALHSKSDNALAGHYYLIGNSVMSYEMAQTFDAENNFISILTAIAIFLVVAITFKSLTIPAILVVIIQCSVFITVSIIGLQGYSIYFLALIIVQCILMGATIDYGILFTNYYQENRKTEDRGEALAAAYQGAIHTILTSGSIMIIVTAALSFLFDDPVIAQICRTIAIGALSATLLIMLVLPGTLAAFDKIIQKRSKKRM